MSNLSKNKEYLQAIYGGLTEEVSKQLDMIDNIIFTLENKSIGSNRDTSIEDAILTRTITEYSNHRITRLGNNAIRTCDTITYINLPNVTSVGQSAIRECTKLTTVNLPKCTTLAASAFYGSKLIKTLDFPLVTSISSTVFHTCSALTALILRSSTLCTLSNTSSFTSTPIASGTGYIYVPSALLTDYQAATNWSTYAAQFRALESYTVDGTTTGALDSSKI